jgi:Ca2+/H+ antiporter
MGFASFFQPGTLMQLIAVMMFTMLYTMVLCLSRPYKDPVDDALAITNQAMLFLTMLGALMIKCIQGFISTGVYEKGYDATFVNGLLVASAIVVALGAVGAVLFSVLRTHKQLQDEADGADRTEDEQGHGSLDVDSARTEEVTVSMKSTKLVL